MKKIAIMLGICIYLCMYVCITDTSLVMALPCMSDEQSKAITDKLTVVQQYDLREKISYRVRKEGATLENIEADLNKLTIVSAAGGLLNNLIDDTENNEIIKAVIDRLIECKEENVGTYSKPKIAPVTKETITDALSYALVSVVGKRNRIIISYIIKKASDIGISLQELSEGKLVKNAVNRATYFITTGSDEKTQRPYASFLENLRDLGVDLSKYNYKGVTVADHLKFYRNYFPKSGKKPQKDNKK